MKDDIRLLIVEDNEAIGFFIKEDLEEQGYQVDSATTGEDALKKLESETFQIVILDIRLNKDISGIDILKKIKSKKKLRDTYVIMHTVFGAPGDIKRAKQLGADAYVAKLSGDEDGDQLLKEVTLAKEKILSPND